MTLRFSISSFLFVAFVAAFGSAEQADAQTLYGYRSSSGVVTFTSRKPVGKSFWTIAPRPPRSSSFIHRSGGGKGFRPRPSQYDSLIMQMAKAYKLEPALVKAVIHAESAFNPRAVSHKGARGLMQVMPATARRFGIDNLYSPVDNIVAGVRYLQWLYEHFNGNITFVLAGYNAGEGAVKRYSGVPPYTETRNYVKRVLQLRDHYRCDYSGQKRC